MIPRISSRNFLFHSTTRTIFQLPWLLALSTSSGRAAWGFSSAPNVVFSTHLGAQTQLRNQFTSPYSDYNHGRRLFGSEPTAPQVEISPSNHGTTPLKDSFLGPENERQQVDPGLLRVLKEQGWNQPTTIQANAIPLLREGYDVMASSQTGSGKSLMFALPMVQTILEHKKHAGDKTEVLGLIISPTRELAIQTSNVLKSLSQHHRQIKISLATGGESTKLQQKSLSSASIVVGTPGRILQFTDERRLSLRKLRFLVIDEADRLMDLGFEPQLTRIAKLLRNNNQKQKHQSVLCSATFPASVQRIAADFLNPDYFFVSIGRVGSTHSRIRQTFEWTHSDAMKTRAVAQNVQSFLNRNKKGSNQSIIIFANTKHDVERYGKALSNDGVKCRIIHGDKSQSDRNKALKEFANGNARALVATDVAARGLDIQSIGLVIQADTPRDIDTYTHRVGRTGRAGAKGEAVTLVDGRSKGLAGGLVELMREAGQPVPAWLVGMMHISRAEKLQEEEQIMSGGGGLDPESSGDEAVVNDEFSGQDFRRHAVEGSYGAGRDVSYRSFDDEAYSSEANMTIESNEISTESFTEIEQQTQAQPATQPSLSIDLHRESYKLVESRPTKKLLDFLSRIDGSNGIGKEPRESIVKALSSQRDQRLRYEYYGNFPFHLIFPLIKSQQSNFNKRTSEDSSLPRVLMVAEKPSIALAIADALCGPGGHRKKRGISRALPVYEFTTSAFQPDNASGKPTKSLATVTSVVGHIFSLGFDAQNQTQSDPFEYFHLPIVKQEESTTSKLRVIEHLRALSADADHLVLWLDCDPEGENIAHEVMAVTRKAFDSKPGGASDRIRRARFSAISPKALRDASSVLEKPDADLSRSVDARQELDLRVGVAFTRLLTWKCVGVTRKRFSATTRLVSYGPCQTPALSFCVDRAHEIQQFQPETFWKTNVAVDVGRGKSVPLIWKNDYAMPENAAPKRSLAEDAVAAAALGGASALVVSVDETPSTISPPLGLNTVALLQAGSKALGMSPKSVMSVAEKLYSAGFISYPRTETTRYDPNGFDVRAVLRQHANHESWGKSVSYLLRTKYAKTGRPPLRGRDVGDHPPITPLKAASRNEVGGGTAWRIYEFVVRNFIGSLHNELHYTRRVTNFKIVSDEEASGVTDGSMFELPSVSVDSLGFSDVCRWVLKDIGAAPRGDPGEDLVEGQRFPIVQATVEEGKTKPPTFLQEHELIALMDQNRIGTDASMAVHVNNIIDRGYVVLCDETGAPLRHYRPQQKNKPQPRQIGRYMIPTPLGMSLIHLFGSSKTNEEDDHAGDEASPAFLAKPAVRERIEDEVKQIASGDLDKEECVQRNVDWFAARYQEFAQSLSRDRVGEFAQELAPTRESLKSWRKFGIFAPPAAPQPTKTNRKGGNQRRATPYKGKKAVANKSTRGNTARKHRPKVQVR